MGPAAVRVADLAVASDCRSRAAERRFPESRGELRQGKRAGQPEAIYRAGDIASKTDLPDGRYLPWVAPRGRERCSNPRRHPQRRCGRDLQCPRSSQLAGLGLLPPSAECAGKRHHNQGQPNPSRTRVQEPVPPPTCEEPRQFNENCRPSSTMIHAMM